MRVLGSPNPGQSFGRGLSGPQATEVKMTRAEVGRRRISPYIRLIHFWVPHFSGARPDSIRELHLLMFFGFFAFSNLEEGTWISVVSWRTQLCNMPLCRKKIDVCFFERLENSEKVREFWSSLGGPHSATNWQRALGFYS